MPHGQRSQRQWPADQLEKQRRRARCGAGFADDARDAGRRSLGALRTQRLDVHADGTPAQWRGVLTPNQPQLAQSIKGLEMSGGDYLQALRITLGER